LLLEGLAVELEALGFVDDADPVVLIGKKLLLKLRGLKDVLELNCLLLAFALFLVVFQLQGPAVIVAIAKDGFHVVERVLVEAGGINSKALVPGPGNFQVLLALNAFLVVLRVIIFNEIVELVGVCAVAWTTVGSFVGRILLIVRKYAGKTGARIGSVLVAVTSLETLEFCLGRMMGKYTEWIVGARKHGVPGPGISVPTLGSLRQ
jgi:hypothetical protein